MKYAALSFALLTVSPALAHAGNDLQPLVIDVETPPVAAPEPAPVVVRMPDAPPAARHGTALLASGYALLGSVYAMNLFAASIVLSETCYDCGYHDNSAGGWLFVPVAGPIVYGASTHADSAGMGLLVFDALTELGSIAMIIGGHAMGAHRATPPPRVSWSVLPVAPGATAGLSLTLRTF